MTSLWTSPDFPFNDPTDEQLDTFQAHVADFLTILGVPEDMVEQEAIQFTRVVVGYVHQDMLEEDDWS